MASVLDVSKYVLELCGEMTTMKLQKLVYYCQAYSLAKLGIPLFADDFQAWANGPVNAMLYGYHKGRFSIKELNAGSSSNLSKSEKAIISAVCSKLCSLSGNELSARTHSEDPWKKTRGSLPRHERCSAIISKDAMKAYYKAHPII